MDKKSQFNLAADFSPAMAGPTVGSLEHAILLDMRISEAQKRAVLIRLSRDLGGVPAGTPLTPSLLSRLGIGLVGAVLMRLLGAGAGGSAAGALAAIIIDHYLSSAGSGMSRDMYGGRGYTFERR